MALTRDFSVIIKNLIIVIDIQTVFSFFALLNLNICRYYYLYVYAYIARSKSFATQLLFLLTERGPLCPRRAGPYTIYQWIRLNELYKLMKSFFFFCNYFSIFWPKTEYFQNNSEA